MKKIFLMTMALCCLLVIGCKKSSTTNTPTVPANGWKLGTTSYTTFYGFRFVDGSDGSLSLSVVDRSPADPAANSALLHFAAPPAAGTYKVVAYSPTSGPAANEVVVHAGSSSDAYWSTGSGTVYVTVTVNAGKLTAVVPDVQLTNGTATSTLTGTLIEN